MAKEYQHRFFKTAKNLGLRSLFFVLLGFLLGILSKWMDIIPAKQFGFWGPLFSAGAEIFSRINIWILLAVWIAVRSKTPLQAALSVFLFFSSMLTGYYGYAEWADAYYSIPYVIGWSVAAVCTPVFAGLSWYTTQKGRVPSILRMGITSCMIFTSFRLGGRIFIPDLALSFLMMILLFSKKSFLKRTHFNF